MGGMTNQTGSAGQNEEYGQVTKDTAEEDAGSAGSRSSQGYGSGSGVGG